MSAVPAYGEFENLTLTEAELARCDPRPGQGGEVVRASCPFHRSDHQRSLRVNRETGHFKCFQCQAWGYMDWARESYRPPPGSTPGVRRTARSLTTPSSGPRWRVTPDWPVRPDIGELSRLYQAALPGSLGEAYLRRRRIPLDLALAYGIGYAETGRWVGRNRHWPLGRLVFPHTDPEGRLLSLYGRAVDGDEEAPKEVRHDQLPGGRWYFNGRALTAGAGPLFVCEGPFDALTLIAAGCPRTMAIFGVDGWRWEWARSITELLLAYDLDDAGRAAATKLARAARLRGKEVRLLPPEAYGRYGDVSAAWTAGALELDSL